MGEKKGHPDSHIASFCWDASTLQSWDKLFVRGCEEIVTAHSKHFYSVFFCRGSNSGGISIYQVFESFEDKSAWEYQPAPACPTAQSRNLVPIWLEIPVIETIRSCNH